jgi:hypothetical protein
MSTGNDINQIVDQAIPLLERIACALERLADQPAEGGQSAGPKVSREAEAMVWAVTHQITSNREIAEHFGVVPSTVRRWPQLQTLLNGLRVQQAGELKRGFHTTNGIEAEDF